MKRWPLYLLAPTVLAIALAVLPLALGESTLFHSDVFGLHLGIKAAQAQAFGAGELPLVDLARTTGEPLLGNANGLPLYPTNLLYLAAPVAWAFNAHYWLHWLLAPFAFYWLARSFKLGPGGASAAAVFWSTGGYFLSQLNFYNLVAVAALAPAFVASWLAAGEKPRLWPVSALLLALLLLAGDPFSAALALGMGLLALVFRPGGGAYPWRGALASLAAALLLASPGIVELLRILPTSLRAVSSRDLAASLSQSLEWAALPDLLLPFFLGDFDLTYWGRRFYEGRMPLFPTLFPGLLALAALLAAGRGGLSPRPARWAWLLVGGGLFFALGEQNPGVVLLYHHLPGFSALRFPIKFALPLMVGCCLLGGIGFERFLAEAPRRRTFTFILGGLTALYALALGALLWLPAPLESWLRSLEPTLFAGPALAAERSRWAGTLFLLAACGLLLLLCSRLAQRSALLAAALMLALGSVFQLQLLAQLHTGTGSALLAREPAALAAVPPGSLVFHRATSGQQFLPADLIRPGNDALLAECDVAELASSLGAYWHRRYALARTNDYLDSYLAFYFSWKLENAPDARALPALTALGVDRLLAGREIASDAADQVELLGRFPNACRRELFVYRLRADAGGEFLMPGNIRRARDLEEGFASLGASPLDPRRTVLLSGMGEVADRPPGTIRVIAASADAFELEADSPAGGVLVARRNWLPFYRAFVDGRPARLEVANLLHLGLELPAGRHHVRVEADRRPLHAAFAASAATLLLLLAAFRRLPATAPPSEP